MDSSNDSNPAPKTPLGELLDELPELLKRAKRELRVVSRGNQFKNRHQQELCRSLLRLFSKVYPARVEAPVPIISADFQRWNEARHEWLSTLTDQQQADRLDAYYEKQKQFQAQMSIRFNTPEECDEYHRTHKLMHVSEAMDPYWPEHLRDYKAFKEFQAKEKMSCQTK